MILNSKNKYKQYKTNEKIHINNFIEYIRIEF